jgi:RNA polymerase sigma-70 factor, ECF subfamily
MGRHEAAMRLESRVAQLLASGDVDGAATLVLRELKPGLERFLEAFLRDHADAEDACSRVQEAVWKGLPAFRGESSLRSWTLALAAHEAMRVRDHPWRRHVRRFQSGEMSGIAFHASSRSKVRLERRSVHLERLRSNLTPGEQILLTLKVDQQLSWDEIAEVFSAGGRPVTVNTLSKRYERMKRRLASKAREQGLLDGSSLTDPDHGPGAAPPR